MVHHITDHNISAMDFNEVQNSVLLFSHSHFTQFEYKAAASIKYVHSGHVKYLIDGQIISLSAGNYLFVNAEVDVVTTISREATGFSIFLDSGVDINKEMSTFPIFDVETTNRIESWKNRTLDSPQEMIQFTNHLINNYLTGISQYLNLLSLKTVNAKMDVLKKLFEARSLIESQVYSNLSLDMISKTILLSKHELVRRYKEVFGITPYKYFQQCKIEATKEELLAGKTLWEIATKYQLADPFTYSKLFKKMTGVTPTQYRAGKMP